MIHWNSSYEIGNRFIDSEHRILFDIASEFTANGIDSIAKFKEIYLELMLYAKFHFANEELMMKDIGYEDLANHVMSHRLIADEMRNLIAHPASLDELKANLDACLQRWISTHILREDMAYKQPLAEWRRSHLGM